MMWFNSVQVRTQDELRCDWNVSRNSSGFNLQPHALSLSIWAKAALDSVHEVGVSDWWKRSCWSCGWMFHFCTNSVLSEMFIFVIKHDHVQYVFWTDSMCCFNICRDHFLHPICVSAAQIHKLDERMFPGGTSTETWGRKKRTINEGPELTQPEQKHVH